MNNRRLSGRCEPLEAADKLGGADLPRQQHSSCSIPHGTKFRKFVLFKSERKHQTIDIPDRCTDGGALRTRGVRRDWTAIGNLQLLMFIPIGVETIFDVIIPRIGIIGDGVDFCVYALVRKRDLLFSTRSLHQRSD